MLIKQMQKSLEQAVTVTRESQEDFFYKPMKPEKFFSQSQSSQKHPQHTKKFS